MANHPNRAKWKRNLTKAQIARVCKRCTWCLNGAPYRVPVRKPNGSGNQPGRFNLVQPLRCNVCDATKIEVIERGV